MRTGFVSALLILVATQVAAQSNGLTLVGQLHQPHGGPGPNYGFYYASLWGYVSPEGREYALMGCYSGTSIIDLDANPIQEVAYIPGANSEWKELKTWGHYAYVVADVSGSQGLQIINLSQLPDTAWLVRSITSIGGKNIARNHTVTVSDGYLYLNGSTGGGQTGGTLILSLADPENPVYVGQYQPAYLHDTFVRRDTLYGAAIYGQGVYIASLANKTAPVTIGQLTYPGAGTHNTWVSVNGRYVFTTDEIGSTAKNMKVFDIAELPAYDQGPSYTANPTAIIHNVHGRGNYAYISYYAAGVYVANVTNPRTISTAGHYDTYTGTGTGYIGCWGVYPYFPSGRIIASDTQTGLYVFTFTGLAPRLRSPLIAPVDQGYMALSQPMEFHWRSATSQAADPHHYELHLWGSGVDTVLSTNDTTVVLGPISGMQLNQQYQWTVWIKDEFTSVRSENTFSFTTPEMITQFSLEGDWNLVSLPLAVANPAVAAVFPTAGSQAFGFLKGAGYAGTDTLENGKGYWVLFPSAQSVAVGGSIVDRDTFDLVEGWNLIGSISESVQVADIVQTPPGIVASSFYGYNSTGYVTSNVIAPGKAYWVKASQAGQIVLASPAGRKVAGRTR